MAFYYNKVVGATIENGQGKVGEDNDAVVALFGHKKELKNGKESGQKGRVDFEDLFVTESSKKIFDHNSIDRFTGGTIDGALFAEETVRTDEEIFVKLEVKKDAFPDGEIGANIQYAFEEALKDICTGMLPLGGMITKGHGVFCGRLEREDVVLEDNLSTGVCNDF